MCLWSGLCLVDVRSKPHSQGAIFSQNERFEALRPQRRKSDFERMGLVQMLNCDVSIRKETARSLGEKLGAS